MPINFRLFGKRILFDLTSLINEVRKEIVENPSDLYDAALEEVQTKLELYSLKLDERISKKSEHKDGVEEETTIFKNAIKYII